MRVTSAIASEDSAGEARVPPERVRGGCVVVELDEEGVVADVGGHALELEGLEAGPAEEAGVCGHVFAETLDEAVVVYHARAGLFGGRDLGDGVLADRLM